MPCRDIFQKCPTCGRRISDVSRYSYYSDIMDAIICWDCNRKEADYRIRYIRKREKFEKLDIIEKVKRWNELMEVE